MLLIRGRAGGTALTGTLYEADDTPPEYEGSPDTQAPYVWVCDAFYEVDSGGQVQHIDDRTIRIAFESPHPKGFTDRERAIEAATDHIQTQFARIGIDPQRVEIDVTEATPDIPT